MPFVVFLYLVSACVVTYAASQTPTPLGLFLIGTFFAWLGGYTARILEQWCRGWLAQRRQREQAADDAFESR